MGHRTFPVISAREPKDGRDSKIAVEVDSQRKVIVKSHSLAFTFLFLGESRIFPVVAVLYN